ncbi:MAG TPA: pyridoxamine 5'-phosphate oxidase family protein [Candidatus Limnocylindrales bacterium]|nr:pyridoxamine 5'-phosphate oxidase family protein [Candidatus Limnocylindrales bacterium]
MPDRPPSETTNLDGYGFGPLDWNRAHDQLANGAAEPRLTFFLGTTDPDGRPHATGIGVRWHDGDLFFSSGPRTRKARNLGANPACSISTSLEGIDLVLEGHATKVDEPSLVETLAAGFREGGWTVVEVVDGRFTGTYSAPSAGPPPWDLYRFRFDTAFGVATAEPYGATRWRFD